MGKVKIRYYVTRKAWKGSRATWGYWCPSEKMMKHGFGVVRCGVDGPDAWKVAEKWNARWDETKAKLRAGETVTNAETLEPIFPPGSLGEAFARFRVTATWADKAERTREDWMRGWRHIKPVFGDVDLETVALEDVDAWYGGPETGLLARVGVREAHRAMKIWRALWRVAGSLKRDDGKRYCDRDSDPSLGIRRKTPKARTAIWDEGEAVRLVKQAWRMGYRGLAAALAVSWDTMLSPVDVRSITTATMFPDALGPLISLDRTKTGRSAIGTLSRRTERLLQAYIDGLPFTLHPDTPIFHTRGGQPGPKGGRPRPPAVYSKDTLGDDFRVVREATFPGDTRKISDCRRSGAIEATAGQVTPAALAGKMANSIDSNRELQATYIPNNASLVRLADVARARGRKAMRDAKSGGK